MRKAGDVRYVDVSDEPDGRTAVGTVEYASQEDVRAAIRDLNGSDFPAGSLAGGERFRIQVIDW
jgi:hypothetical protein